MAAAPISKAIRGAYLGVKIYPHKLIRRRLWHRAHAVLILVKSSICL